MKNQKAITLIALIVTIIILLILAGVVISSLIDSGLFEKAKIAKQKQAEAEVKEKINLLVSEYAIDREQGKSLAQFLAEKKDSGEIDDFIDNNDGTFDIIINGYTTTINESDLSTTEPQILSDIMVTCLAKEFANNKIQALITVKSQSGGIKEIRLINNVIVQGNNKSSITFDHPIEANTEYQVEVELTNGTTSTKIIKYEDTEAPTGTILIGATSYFLQSPIEANIELKDNKSGINIGVCKWVVTESSETLGTDDESKYTGGTLTNSEEKITTDPMTTEGIYYIHVLASDNVGNKTEIISESVTIRSGYGIYTPGDFMSISDANGNYYIMDDLNMSGYDLSETPLAKGNLTSGKFFKGTIDGQGHIISNLTAGSNSVIYGLGDGAVLKNIIFKNVNLFKGLCTYSLGTPIIEKVGITGTVNTALDVGSTFFSTAWDSSSKPKFTDCYDRTSGGAYLWMGYNWPYTLERCYSATTTTSGANKGDSTYSYYNSSIASTGCGIGLTTQQFALRSSFDSSWDFKESDEDTEYTWYIDPNTGYPELHFNN